MKMVQLILLLFILFYYSGCMLEQSESIEPFAEVQTIQQSQKMMLADHTAKITGGGLSNSSATTYYLSKTYPDSYIVKLRYKVKELDVYEFAGMDGNTLEILGNSLIRFFAKLYFKAGGKFNLDVDNFTFDIPEIDIDEELINEIRITKAQITYSEGFEHYDFKFVDKLEAAIPQFIFSQNRYIDFLLFGYDKHNNNCNYKCINFDIYVDDALYYIKNRNYLTISPMVVASGLPEEDLIIDGEIELEVSIKLPF